MQVSKDILTLLLSYCRLSDVMSIKLTCREWNAVTETIPFWKRHVDYAMQKVFSGLNAKHWNLFQKRPFDNFIFKELTWRESCGWLFQKNSWKVHVQDTAVDIYLRVPGTESEVLWFFRPERTVARHCSPKFETLVRNHRWIEQTTVQHIMALKNASIFLHSIIQRDSVIQEVFEPGKKRPYAGVPCNYGPIYHLIHRHSSGFRYEGDAVRINFVIQPYGGGVDGSGELVEYHIQKKLKLEK